jgi:hypothetical protein
MSGSDSKNNSKHKEQKWQKTLSARYYAKARSF